MTVISRDLILSDSGTLKLRAEKERSILQIIKTGDMILFPSFSPQNQYRWYSAQILGQSLKGPEPDPTFLIGDQSGLRLDDALVTAILGNNSFRKIDNAMLERLTGFSGNLRVPRVTLSIKVKKGQYIRIIHMDSSRPALEERYMNWNEWESVERDLRQCVSAVNQALKHQNQREVSEAQGFLADRIVRLLQVMDLKINYNIKNSIVDVFWQDNTLLMPIEFAFRDSLVVNHLVRKHSSQKTARNNAVFIYSNQLESSNQEVMGLTTLMPADWTYLSFAEERSLSYQSEIRASGIVHFAGHGKCADSKGLIALNGSDVEEWASAEGLRGVFLNCCSAGLYPDGIVGNLIGQSTQWVIASPFEIRDSLSWSAVQDYYRAIPGSQALMAFLSAGLLNPGFFKTFRYFQGFDD